MSLTTWHTYFLGCCWLSSGVGWAQGLTTSNLPIAVITASTPIEDEPKTMAHLKIIDNGVGQINHINDPATGYDGQIAIELRGNSSQDFEKLSYGFELRDSLNNDTSVALLGLPKEEDWILYASPIDKTFLRNAFTYELWRKMGYWASHTRYCEVILNNEYVGLYALMEKIKRDNNRVDIAKLTANDHSGDDISGGYILRIDWLPETEETSTEEDEVFGHPGEQTPDGWWSRYSTYDEEFPLFIHHYYPKSNRITHAQRNYIQSYFNDFEDAIYSNNFTNASGQHYRQYLNSQSFADFLLINELSRNPDGYKLSTYLHKDKASKGGKLIAGPVWDFDLAYANVTYCGDNNPAGWTFLQREAEGCEDITTMPQWWRRLLCDPSFTDLVGCRWQELRQSVFHLDSMNAYIDATAATIMAAQARNYETWDEALGENIWDQPTPIPTTYAEEIAALKAWLKNRVEWMDNNMMGSCGTNAATDDVLVYPNPFSTVVNVAFECPTPAYVEVHDLSGRLVAQGELDALGFTTSINLTHVPAGTYFLYVVVAHVAPLPMGLSDAEMEALEEENEVGEIVLVKKVIKQ